VTRITGRFEPPGARDAIPYIKAIVQIPRLNIEGPVSFLVDTGGVKTTLHPPDITALGIDIAQLDQNRSRQLTGVGGEAEYRIEDALLRFTNIDVPIEILIGPVEPQSFQGALVRGLPAILGRDILNQGRLVVDYVENHHVLDIHEAERISGEEFSRTTFGADSYARYRERLRQKGLAQ
jgi:hypothetical protein